MLAPAVIYFAPLSGSTDNASLPRFPDELAKRLLARMDGVEQCGLTPIEALWLKDDSPLDDYDASDETDTGKKKAEPKEQMRKTVEKCEMVVENYRAPVGTSVETNLAATLKGTCISTDSASTELAARLGLKFEGLLSNVCESNRDRFCQDVERTLEELARKYSGSVETEGV